MRKAIVIPALALCVGLAASSAYRFVSAADSYALSRLGSDVQLEADSDLMLGIVPTRTTVAGLFKDHAIATPEAAALVSSIGNAFDLRRVRAGQPYTIDRLFDGRIRRFEYEIDGDRRLLATRASLDGAPRFITSVEIIPKQTEVVTVEGEINRETNSLMAGSTRRARASSSRSAWPTSSPARSISARTCSRGIASASWWSAARVRASPPATARFSPRSSRTTVARCRPSASRPMAARPGTTTRRAAR